MAKGKGILGIEGYFKDIYIWNGTNPNLTFFLMKCDIYILI